MKQAHIMILGVGAFAHALMAILKESGARVSCYLTRDYGHYGPKLCGETWRASDYPSPFPLVQETQPDLIIPMSLAWYRASWAKALQETGVPILCATGRGFDIEGERDVAQQLCQQYGLPYPKSYVVSNRLEALELMERDPRPYVLKNPLCSPNSPIHAIVCETPEETRGWLERVDYAEGVFLQEYLGTVEAGHFVFVSGGEITSLVTNQEYKRAFNQNMGPVAGAPLGGIVEQDPEDRYGLAKELIHPLLPWLREVNFHGPLQVTAIQQHGRWHAIEYNIRLGVTSGALILRMMDNPLEAMLAVAQNQPIQIQWNPERRYGVSLTLAGYGYPYVVPMVPRLPVSLNAKLDCDVWWNEVDEYEGQLCMASHQVAEMGHRIADVVAFDRDHVAQALRQAYQNIEKIHCLGSYYRTDIGETLWPPGQG